MLIILQNQKTLLTPFKQKKVFRVEKLMLHQLGLLHLEVILQQLGMLTAKVSEPQTSLQQDFSAQAFYVTVITETHFQVIPSGTALSFQAWRRRSLCHSHSDGRSQHLPPGKACPVLLLGQADRARPAPGDVPHTRSPSCSSRRSQQQLVCCVGGSGRSIDPLYKSDAVLRSLK